METRTVEQVEGWNSRPFSDGYAGLRELSDGEFSGAVRTGGAWLFMLNGRAIGVHEGDLDDFEDADGTAYAAPHPSLPLLFSMQETGGDTRAKYYTNDTPLTEVDSTLSDGGFTGFIELSENVLSGDYYVAYYGGRSMSVAFVGASEQVVSGDEAFERAADEVGIYKVTDVDIDVIDLPEPEEPDDPAPDAPSAGGADGGTAPDSTPATGRDQRRGPSEEADASPATDATETDPSRGGDPSEARDASGTETERRTASGTGSRSERADARDNAPQSARERGDQSAPGGGPTAEASTDAGDAPAERSPDTSSAESAPTEATTGAEVADTDSAEPAGGAASAEVQSEPTPSAAADESPADAGEDEPTTPTGSGESSDERQSDDGEMFEGEAEWRETTTIPSLDPDRTADDAGPERTGERAAAGSTPSPSPSGSATESRGGSEPSNGSAGRRSGAADRSRTDDPRASGESSRASKAREPSSGESTDDADERVAEVRSELRQRTKEVEKLKRRLSSIKSERDELARERDALRQEVDRLESELDAAESGGSVDASSRLGAGEAFEGTNLFVRYRSKGDATLEQAAAGDAEPDEVNANLQLEHHTQFEAADVAVDGARFEEFLTDSFEYRFASWVVEQLLYEIRETGYESRLQGLYDAISKIDRVDFHGSVGAGTDGDDTRQETFDVIMRDRMGNPLIVADLNDSRDPTTGEMMGSLVDAATGVAQAHGELVGAFQVTESFFEPAALETTETATSGGLLSREKRASFVKLSRKRGFHLCLVESRSGGFHLNVPEL
ncbi:DUF7527 domain-containing protein [Halorussus marinus]|uniref:DUF7527 domain-containing protein n=1 Tax=Halorussus marinus TaxID=2505976 RepID=UPI00106EF001|nr:hypothetical protein [Halorussus marinus]